MRVGWWSAHVRSRFAAAISAPRVPAVPVRKPRCGQQIEHRRCLLLVHQGRSGELPQHVADRGRATRGANVGLPRQRGQRRRGHRRAPARAASWCPFLGRGNRRGIAPTCDCPAGCAPSSPGRGVGWRSRRCAQRHPPGVCELIATAGECRGVTMAGRAVDE